MNYLPSEYIDSDYSYYFNGIYYVVKTDNNCNNDVCDCYSIFPDNNYLISNVYTCSSLDGQFEINYELFTSDKWYRNDLQNTLLVFLVMFIFMIYLPYKIMSRLFGRWLKV